MRRGIVFYNGIEAGYIERTDAGNFIFRYADDYYMDAGMPSISLTLSKRQQQYEADVLFSFFYGLLTEGINKELQCRLLKIDEADDFTRLLKTTGADTIGAITIKEKA